MALQPLASEAIPQGMRTDAPEIDYPDSDGNPMSDNTEQYRWIVMIKEIEIMYADDPNIFVAGNLLWYPVRYTQKRTAPDVMVAIGRPKGKCRLQQFHEYRHQWLTKPISCSFYSPQITAGG